MTVKPVYYVIYLETVDKILLFIVLGIKKYSEKLKFFDGMSFYLLKFISADFLKRTMRIRIKYGLFIFSQRKKLQVIKTWATRNPIQKIHCRKL